MIASVSVNGSSRLTPERSIGATRRAKAPPSWGIALTIQRASGGELVTLESLKERLLRPLAAVVLMLTFATPQTFAQEVERLSAVLVKDVSCGSTDALDGLNANIAASGASSPDVQIALGVIAADAAVCPAIRDAARGFVLSPPPSPAGGHAASASSAVIADALAEAERRAANMKFEVGPPPPRLTRGRNPGL